MKLYIAEKPSLARAIAQVLPKPHKKEDGFIRLGNGDCVTWCIGHLLEQAEPESYNPEFKQWKLEHLPIVPSDWKLQGKSKTKKQLGVIKKLLKQAQSLVHAGDPDREGQLLVDEVISYLGVTGDKLKQVQRCLISDLNPPAVKRALSKLRPNTEFVPLSTSALARSRADWLYGINMTRAYTLQGRKVGYQGLLSVGRVQTPILGLVVRRDEEIEKFVSKPFYDVLAHLETSSGEKFTAKWKPSEACAPYMDEEGRVLLKALTENVVRRITGKPAVVTELEQKQKKQPPPLTYNLSKLQIDAAKAFGITAKEVLDTCQSLYERHKLITYPRSDSQYLPKEQHKLAPGIIAAIGNNSEKLTAAVNKANPKLKSKAWNDAKVDAHHAIVPTEKKIVSVRLNDKELKIYELVATQYLAQFYPAYEYAQTKAEFTIEGGLFTASAKQSLQQGWKALYKPEKTDETQLPVMVKGDRLNCEHGELLEKNTQPAKHFTDATLLAAMTGIARYVQDKDIRKILKETDGLGTEATRAGILELLFKRSFLTRQGKNILATEVGRGLINSLPELATTPDMTAKWESILEAICQRQANYQTFMTSLTQQLDQLITLARNHLPTGLAGVKSQQKSWKKKTSSRKKRPQKSTY